MKASASVLKIMRNAARSTVDHPPHLQPGRPADQGRRQVGHGRVRDARQQGPAARSTRGSSGSCPRTPAHGSFNGTDSQLVVLAFAYDSRTKGNVATEIVKYYLPAALRDQEGLPPPRPARARQLLPEQLMGVIRAQPARVTDWAAKSVGAAWRAFDLQLTTYAGLLVAIGLVMAYTNSVEQGVGPARGRHDVHPRPDVGRHRRRRLRPRDGLRLPLAPDPCLADLRPPARPARPDPGDRQRRRRLVALGHDRPADLPVQRDRQDPDDHRPRRATWRRGRAGSTPCRRSSAPACSSGRRSPSSCSSPTSGRRSSSARSSPGCSGCPAPASAG